MHPKGPKKEQVTDKMDEILLIRLRITSEKIGAELETIPSTVRSENIGQAQVVYNRLQAAVNRLNANLSEYFRLATTPASDEIFLISGQQLLAEETLAELKAKIDQDRPRVSTGFIPNVKLRGVPESYVLADDGSLSGQVQILIGNDYYFNIIYETKIQLDSNLFLVDSALGWIVSGKTEPQLEEESYVVTYAQTCIEMKLHQPDSPLCEGDIKNLWELECIGICDSPKATREEEAIKNFNETTVKINNRYTVSWPWITYPPDLPNNFGIDFGRLSSLLKRMDQETLMSYDDTFKQQKIVRQVLWTDSQIVIEWCKSNKLLPPFVARRVEEIKTNKDLEIRYVPSSLNPTDVGTRPLRAEEDKEKWLNGPQFITEDPQKWPTTSGSEPTSSLLTGEGLGFQEDIEMVDKEDPVVNVNPMETEEIITANEMIGNNQSTDDKLHKLKEIQAKYFPLEVEGKETNLSRNLGVSKDIDDLLRCKGRMKNANWSFDKRYPILIPKESDFTKEIIMKTHQENKHVGVSHTLDKIRETYWIPQGRSKVQRILKGCPECMKHDGGPYRLPETPALPKERVNYSSPFTYVGTDYLGPLLVNNGNGSCKRWISLYTCLAVRAIHLEVVKDLTAEEGLLALKRMISARGVPTLITSDNAAHYKLLSEILQDPYCIEKEIKWKFIPQLAPWHGGFYERLIGLTKNCMKKTLQKHLLNDSQLATTVKEIEAVLNTRPLTYVDSEPDHVLKPSDFLTMGKCIVMETSSMDPSTSHGTVTKDNLIKGWKKALIILREIKEMFENRYLLNLRERYSHHPKEPRVTSKLTPKIGQIVQIKGDTKNRINWKVGKIVSLKEGADGLCRVATVQVGDTIYTRSIAHLYPLEIEDGEEQCKQTSHEESVEESVQVPDVPHPTRRDDVMKESTNDVLKTSEQKSYQLTKLNESEEIPSDSALLEPASSQLHEPEPKSIPEPDPLAVRHDVLREH
ncbi:uncharacterized protein LOC125236138 [Leguminivora glycinivorella]|uniref:uncharacterized protein LOC125236138 n=1 Tax=Leguminivora glycinivorella TaxID=1035111 RepID=UPI00200BC59A|nr:uncharacterized protein LOC125236138 [Leguminivora glycinivorella]